MENERKTLDDRQKMTELERLRHSAAHVMATAIVRLWPDAQFASGPAVENGFYYDVELSHRISPEDFPKIEEEMKKEIKANHTFEKITVTREQALEDSNKGRLGALGERPGNPSKFKIGNLADIPAGEHVPENGNGRTPRRPPENRSPHRRTRKTTGRLREETTWGLTAKHTNHAKVNH